MQDERRIDDALANLWSNADAPVPDGFMDAMWMRAGRLEEAAAGRTRLALLAVMGVIGLGAGFVTTQAPATAEPTGYRLVEGADLSPSALLHVEP